MLLILMCVYGYWVLPSLPLFRVACFYAVTVWKEEARSHMSRNGNWRSRLSSACDSEKRSCFKRRFVRWRWLWKFLAHQKDYNWNLNQTYLLGMFQIFFIGIFFSEYKKWRLLNRAILISFFSVTSDWMAAIISRLWKNRCYQTLLIFLSITVRQYSENWVKYYTFFSIVAIVTNASQSQQWSKRAFFFASNYNFFPLTVTVKSSWPFFRDLQIGTKWEASTSQSCW